VTMPDSNLGSFFGCVPARPCISAFAVAWFVLGIYHLLVVCGVVLGSVAGEMGNAMLEDSCQGSQCHDRWRESFGTCRSEKKSTFFVRYLTVAVLGIMFGWIGITGTNERDNLKMKSFGFFLIGMAALFGGVLLGDLAYVEVCGKMSLNMVKDVMPLIPPGELDRLRSQGHRDLAKLPVTQLKVAMGYDFVVLYAGLASAVCIMLLYVAFSTISTADKVIGGPLGLGPLFHIQTAADRDEMEAARKADAIMGQLNMFAPAPSYGTLPELLDGQRFPYVSFQSGAQAVPYGHIGAPKQQDIQDPRFPEYLGVMGI